MKDIEPVLEVLGNIARAKGTSMSAIALNYNIIKGAVPAVGVRSPEQAQQNVGALGWRLSDDEVRKIDSVVWKEKLRYCDSRAESHTLRYLVHLQYHFNSNGVSVMQSSWSKKHVTGN